MDLTTQIFKYPRSKKIEDIVIFFSIFLFLAMIFIIDDDISEIQQGIGSIILIGVFILTMKNTYLLNKNFEIGEEVLKINNRIIQSKVIRYDAIRKITILEVENMAEGDDYLMTIFLKEQNISFIVSDIEKYYIMIPLLEKKGIEYNFNVIHQDVNGHTIKDLRGNNTSRFGE